MLTVKIRNGLLNQSKKRHMHAPHFKWNLFNNILTGHKKFLPSISIFATHFKIFKLSAAIQLLLLSSFAGYTGPHIPQELLCLFLHRCFLPIFREVTDFSYTPFSAQLTGYFVRSLFLSATQQAGLRRNRIRAHVFAGAQCSTVTLLLPVPANTGHSATRSCYACVQKSERAYRNLYQKVYFVVV